ncbi:uncharacterized protein LOC111884530 [Lactuca sativa]|uniref:uncharacterized protein LOC111884530 n=1 Tax=Lactuca sativa TaxID=4236 RepID=UPI000CD7FF15|nr:uncharacterized protein LOC111884530 [Lactuca sativa]
MYGTLTQPLLQTILKPDATSTEVWKSIEALFLENKESKAMELDDELCSITTGDPTIVQYCTHITSIDDILANIGSLVPERNLVIYAINGLSPKFAHVVTTIRHQKPFLTFLEMRSMLTLEECSMIKEQNRVVQATHQDHASAPTILNTTYENMNHENRTPNNHRGTLFNGRDGGQNSRGGGRGGRPGRGGNRGRTGGIGGNFGSPALVGNIGWGIYVTPRQGGGTRRVV